MALNIYNYLNQGGVVEDDLCFVIMPFGGRQDEIFHRGIKPIVEELGFRCMRADLHVGSAPILFEIFEDILKAKVIIADLTDSNPNVFYELGVCHALKRNVILLNRKGNHVPFDLYGVRHLQYEDQLGAEADLQRMLRGALASSIDEEAELFDKPSMVRNLKKFSHLWKTGGEVLIGLEEFMEIVLGLSHLSPSDDEMAFLCQTAAHYGKLMKRMCEFAHQNETAIGALAFEAATGSYARVPWRAAVMLEHLNPELVKKSLIGFAGEVRNRDIFPGAILDGSTTSILRSVVDDPETPKEIGGKLREVLRQIRAEFGS